ncbi:acyltransferase family protein [Intestinibaculum porci]|uniref:acyltransferase family protein n=1 Tax=Intestinibaculum porci TaxID=2487118 RepID=UPI0038CC0E43
MRESGIESLKIIAIFMIVLFHVVQTLVSNSSIITNNSYVINISNATTNVQNIILLVFYHFGSLGNSIFFICSTWFMLNSNRYNKQKWLLMLVEIWFISISILFITFVILRANIPASLMIKSLFPTLFMNNWYMTCYLIFYPLHPILNNVINKMNQKQLFRCTAALSFMYILMDFIEWDWFFPSMIILWITIYFCVAYMKKYLTDFANSMKKKAQSLFLWNS